MMATIVALALCQPSYGEILPQPPASALYQALGARVALWKRALTAGEIRQLTQFALDDYREQVSRDLKNPKSDLSEALFGKRGASVAKQVSSASEYVVFKRIVDESEDYATTCFPARALAEWPKTHAELFGRSTSEFGFCVDWVRDLDGHWYVSYDFAYEDGKR